MNVPMRERIITLDVCTCGPCGPRPFPGDHHLPCVRPDTSEGGSKNNVAGAAFTHVTLACVSNNEPKA